MTTIMGSSGITAAVPPRAISQRLLDPLRVVAGRVRVLTFLRACFQVFILSAAVWLAVVLIMGSGTRVPLVIGLPLAAIAWGAIIYGFIRFFRPVMQVRSLASAARLVDDALPDTQERISSAIELSQEKDPDFRGSSELIACLIRQAEHHADCMNPAAIVSGREVFRWFMGTVSLMFLWFLVLVILTPNVLLGFHRTLNPFAAASELPAPIMLVQPGDMTIAQGQSQTITLDVRPPPEISLDTGELPVQRAWIVRHYTTGLAGPAGEAGAGQDLNTELKRTGPRTFQIDLDNIQQSFQYHLVSEGSGRMRSGESQTYTITVQARPGVAAMTLDYTFPAYTHLAPRTDASREGAIDALVGTRVKITLEPTMPVTTAEITIDDDGTGQKDTITLEPGAASPTSGRKQYSAELNILKSTQYRISLKNSERRDNPDNQPRPITARPDAAPAIEILSPTITPLDVRPDDSVPLHYLATDDFGITKIEVLTQVDDQPQKSTVIPLGPAAGEARAGGEWNLALADVLKMSTLPGKEPAKITYKLKATDNREPSPQSIESKTQVLTLRKDATPLAQRLDTAAVRDLASAIKKAQEKLNDAEKALDDLKKADSTKTLSDAEKKRVTDATKDLIDAREQLARAADQAEASRLGDVARQVKDVADQPVRHAEEDSVKTQLAADQPAARNEALESARKNIDEAQARLDRLAGTLQDTAKDQPLAQALEKLADKQQKLAEALALKPNDPSLREQQRQLQKDLDDLIKNNPQLQKPVADAQQAKVDELVKNIQQLQRDSQPIAEQLHSQTQGNPDQVRLHELARQQEGLNREITQFNQQQSEALRQSNTRGPDAPKLDLIPPNLEANKMDAANRDQKAAAQQLDQAADRLDAAQKRLDPNAASRQQAADRAAQQVRDAATMQEQVNQLAGQIQKAKDNHNPPTRPGDPANQQASKLADEIKKEAQQMTQPAQKAAAQAAAAAAELAKNQATKLGNADAAQQQLANAANQLAEAARQAQNAAAPPPAGQNPGQAAQEARALAQKQHDLADQSSQIAKAQEDAAAAKANASANAQKAQQIADQITQASKDAQNLQQQTQGAAPDLSDRAAKAAKALDQAAQAERSAAQATRGNDPAGASAKQDQTADSLATAEESLTGQPSASRAHPNAGQPNADRLANAQNPKPGSNPPPSSTPPSSPGNNQGSSSNQNPSQSPSSGSSPPSPGSTPSVPIPGSPLGRGPVQGTGSSPNGKGQSTDPGQTASGQPGQGQPGSGQAGSGQPSQGQPGSGQAASGQPGQGQPGSGQAASGQPGQGQPGSGQTASGQPGQGQPGSGQAASGQPGQGQPGSGQAASGQPGQGQPGSGQAASGQPGQGQPGSGQAASGQPGQGQPGSGQTASGQPGQGQPGSGQPGQGSGGSPGEGSGRSVPQAVQSARSQQSQAANGNAEAAKQAAQSLAEASKQLMPGGAGSGSGGSGNGQPGSGTPGSGAGSGQGVTITEGPLPTILPKEVQEIGISPSEWARLPQAMQDQLLHSAQQSGPPAYRDMIKNYYSRIARMQADNSVAPGPGAGR